ncbi:unnamed protein product [Miscanthus lutarioriparius]|uniref:Uncharacterized protein n=1 Tax=Miscanthus lutarioriparius TaxID=422564 RepID=A0A811R4Q8_9POAL|nr:unnamed protein product [Miscanthus lutarioriparius]
MDDDDLATPPTHGISTGSTSGERDVAWKSSSGTEEVVAASVVFRLEHGLAKSLKTLVDAEAANAGALNAIQTAYSKELEAQRQTTERGENLFNVLQKYTEFTHGEIVKAALIIGQNEAKLNLFFTTPEEFRSQFIREALEVAWRIALLKDPVCGSAHCVLAPYWARKLGKQKLTAFQVSPRSGTLYLELEAAARRVRIQGESVTVMTGTLLA